MQFAHLVLAYLRLKLGPHYLYVPQDLLGQIGPLVEHQIAWELRVWKTNGPSQHVGMFRKSRGKFLANCFAHFWAFCSNQSSGRSSSEPHWSCLALRHG